MFAISARDFQLIFKRDINSGEINNPYLRTFARYTNELDISRCITHASFLASICILDSHLNYPDPPTAVIGAFAVRKVDFTDELKRRSRFVTTPDYTRFTIMT